MYQVNGIPTPSMFNANIAQNIEKEGQNWLLMQVVLPFRGRNKWTSKYTH